MIENVIEQKDEVAELTAKLTKVEGRISKIRNSMSQGQLSAYSLLKRLRDQHAVCCT